ncbi:MAG TPA: hypothetical protein VK993_09380 [Chthoniobacterales bacterium]|nr:hypothetical protein [Chthoniobacterales bacterium]
MKRIAIAVTLLVAAVMLAANAMAEPRKPQRDINAVLADHDDRLLAIPGVVGVYVSVLEDGKTACLKVMLSERKSPSEQPIPHSIEGYPVVTELTGELRPLRM